MNDLASAADFLQAYVERLTDISQSDCPDEGICLLGDTRLQYLQAYTLQGRRDGEYGTIRKLFDAKNLTLSFDRFDDEFKHSWDNGVFVYSAVQSPSATAESFAIGARLAEVMLENANLEKFFGIQVESFFCQVRRAIECMHFLRSREIISFLQWYMHILQTFLSQTGSIL